MITVKFKNSLSLLKDENALVNGIVVSINSQLEGINMSTLKYSSQFVQDICYAVECHTKGNRKIDKKTVALKVFSVLFGDDVDLSRIEETIENAHANKLLKQNGLFIKRKLLSFFKFFLSEK